MNDHNLDTLRFGDIIAITDADHSYGRIYRSGAVSIGVIAHSNCVTAGHGPGEVVFVPREGARDEDDGYLMTYVWKSETDTSSFVVLDAANVEAEPIAEVEIPVRVVSGFHSSWIPDPGA